MKLDVGIFRTAISYTLFPITLAACLGCSYYFLYLSDMPVYMAGIGPALGFAICAAMELALPYRDEWSGSQGDVLVDLKYLGLFTALNELLTPFLRIVLVVALANFIFMPGSSQGLSIWPHHLHPLLQVPIAVIAAELVDYWFHRFSHRVGVLWRFHAVHHSPQRLYFVNAARFHGLEIMVSTTIRTVTLFLFGADATIIILYQTYVSCHGLFQHSNIDVRYGVLNYFFSGPELHRWHHSKNIFESDKNFGNNTILWDLVFGTFFLPKGREVGNLGLLNPEYPSGIIQQTLAPFRKDTIDKPADYAERKDYYHQQAGMIEL